MGTPGEGPRLQDGRFQGDVGRLPSPGGGRQGQNGNCCFFGLMSLDYLSIYEAAPYGALLTTLMSALNSLSSSASVAYATQLAQTSAFKRSLNNLGNAVESGDSASASSILTAFIEANPQFASTSSEGSQSQDPINQDFQALAEAVSNDQVDTAKGAWTQIQSDLADSGVTDLSEGPAATAKLLAQSQASISQQILSDAFGASSASNTSITSLLGGSSGSSSSAGVSSSLLSDWFTYKVGGSASPVPSAASAGSNLDTVA